MFGRKSLTTMHTKLVALGSFKVIEGGDRRRSERVSINEPVWLKSGSSVSPCLLKNFSATGACLLLEWPERVAPDITLFFSRSVQTGHRCQVRWKRGSKIGVQFL